MRERKVEEAIRSLSKISNQFEDSEKGQDLIEGVRERIPQAVEENQAIGEEKEKITMKRLICRFLYLFLFVSLSLCPIAAADQLTRQVSSTVNDAYAWGSTSQNSSSDYLNIGDYGSGSLPYYRAAFRFTNVTIPQGATIISAYIKIRSRSNFNADWMYLDINGEAVDDSDSFNYTPYLSQRTLTSETVLLGL